jgi:hypothetical protein
MAKMNDIALLLDNPGGNRIGKSAKQGVPIEVLETKEVGDPKVKWLRIRVKDTAGIAEGWVLASKVDLEGEEDTSIDRAEFAENCIQQAFFVGINAHFVMATAQLRSKITAGKDGDKVGAFRLTVDQWKQALTDKELVLDFAENQIEDWRKQCAAFAVIAFRAQEKFSDDSQAKSTADPKVGKLPSSVELYRAIWPTDAAKLPEDMQEALKLTAKNIEEAIPNVTEVKLEDPVLENANDPASPTNPTGGTATAPDTAPGSGKGEFSVLAPRIMKDLIPAFDLSTEQAAAILGNIGHECNGFKSMQELKPVSGKGGFGWCQWTGSRRRKFFAFCAAKNLPTDSYAGNLEFLKSDLRGETRDAPNAIRDIKNPPGQSLRSMVERFELAFERAGVKSYPQREDFARKALAAFKG